MRITGTRDDRDKPHRCKGREGRVTGVFQDGAGVTVCMDAGAPKPYVDTTEFEVLAAAADAAPPPSQAARAAEGNRTGDVNEVQADAASPAPRRKAGNAKPLPASPAAGLSPMAAWPFPVPPRTAPTEAARGGESKDESSGRACPAERKSAKSQKVRNATQTAAEPLTADRGDLPRCARTTDMFDGAGYA